MPYQPGKFLCSEYDPIPAERAARRAHDLQVCEIVEALPSWRYRVRFADGVVFAANESEVSGCIKTTTFWGGRGGH